MIESKPNPDLHSLALVTHGFLIFGHSLGLAYGIKTRHWLHTWIHFSGVMFSIYSARNHAREL